MKIILTRHGETISNRNGILAGIYDTKLSKNGLIQAKLTAKELSSKKIDVIISSNLIRAKKTAEEINKFHNVGCITRKNLHERFLGKYEGVKGSKRKADYEISIESDADFMKRIKKELNDIYKLYKDKTVLIVAHNGVNKCIISNVLESNKYLRNIVQNNCCINYLDFKEKTKNFIINYTKHLE